ncbi:MAG: glycerophosphodiester phosphodiesterase, partial [Proteobacteria bacterium]|nr:glycerophosphodiester phosphodiesterase [Pseudomonadota bacterium]
MERARNGRRAQTPGPARRNIALGRRRFSLVKMTDNDVLIIAHRGASGYLPEHTLEAKALAYGMGADYLEQDVVATRDDELVVIHDIHLDRVSNVAEKFPDRKRDDGRFYARDFDLAEIRTLRAWERRDDDGITPVFPNRFPTGQGAFRIPTLREEIKLVQGLNKSTGRSVGIYVEIKRPAWHQAEGVDISPILLQLLDDVGYRTREDKIYVQCFDPDEVRRIRHELDCELKLTQLMDNPEWGDYFPEHDFLLTPDGFSEIPIRVHLNVTDQPGFPIPFFPSFTGSAALGDITGDGKMEVVASPSF